MPYIYNADVWCDSCGEEIKKNLIKSDDSADFPQWMNEDEESDCPQHCSAHADCLEFEELADGTKIGKLLSTNLTNDGVEYVKEAVAEGGVVAEFWREAFNWIEFSDENEEEDDDTLLCPICGERIRLTGKRTKNNRVIGSCGDAFFEED